jgi:Concanavalin A-like lectin/glucanases superfamily
MTTTTFPPSTPTLHSFGVASVLAGQKVTLKDVTNSTLTASSWSISFRFRLRGRGVNDTLLWLGPTAYLKLGNSSSTMPRNNHVYAVFTKGDTSTSVDSQVELQVGVWHTITMTVSKVSSTKAEVTIYTDGLAFGDPSSAQAAPVTVNTYSACTDASLANLGGGVDAEFLNISFWKVVLDPVSITESAYQAPAELPAPALLASYDFSTLVNDTTHFTLKNGAELLCVNDAVQFGNGIALPDPNDGLNPGGDRSKSFSIQASIYSIPPITDTDERMSATILSNGLLNDPAAFSLGIQYDDDLQKYHLAVNFPGHSTIVDTHSMHANSWNTIALTWDGKNLVFYINGESKSTHTPGGSAAPQPPGVVIGAVRSAASVSGFTQFFLGQVQGLGVWDRALSPGELADFQTQSPKIRKGMVAYYDLTSTELANLVTGQRLALEGTIFVRQTGTNSFVQAPKRADMPLLNPDCDDYGNLTRLQEENAEHPTDASATLVDETAPLASTRLSAMQVERLAKGVEFYVKHVPAAQQDDYRKLWNRNVRRAIQRVDSASGHVPGSFTSAIEGDFIVSYFNTAQGSIEVDRAPVGAVSPCTTWKINVIATAIATFLSVIGAGFAAKALHTSVGKMFAKGWDFATVFAKTADKTADVSAILTTIQYLLGAGQLTTTLLDCLAGVSWWNLAWTVACIVFNIVSLFATGGAALAFLVANLLLNIASLVYVISQKPANC